MPAVRRGYRAPTSPTRAEVADIVMTAINDTGSYPMMCEVPVGEINGSNAVFTTACDFKPSTVVVILNGLLQKKPDDFNTSGTNTITLAVSPHTGESLFVNYQKA